MSKLQGRVALVTGGIGMATAHRLANDGAAAVLTDIKDAEGELVAKQVREKGHQATFLHHDVTVEDDWRRLVEQTLLAVTQTNVFLGMRTAAHALETSEHGAVINTCSIFGSSGGFGTGPGYHAAKGAVRLMTKDAAIHWAPLGVRVNSIHPGFIDTPHLEEHAKPFVSEMLRATPLGRLGQPEEIAAVVSFLASDDASYITGAEIDVDGGFLAP